MSCLSGVFWGRRTPGSQNKELMEKTRAFAEAKVPRLDLPLPLLDHAEPLWALSVSCWQDWFPQDWLQCCTLRAMTPPKTVHINVPEEAFYLHQTDNGRKFELYFCSGFFLLLFYSDWRSRLTILLCLSVCWSSVHCLYFLSMDGGVSIENIQLQLLKKMLLWGEHERGFSSWRCAVQNIPFLLVSEHCFLSSRWCAKQGRLRSTLSSSPAFVRCY